MYEWCHRWRFLSLQHHFFLTHFDDGFHDGNGLRVNFLRLHRRTRRFQLERRINLIFALDIAKTKAESGRDSARLVGRPKPSTSDGRTTFLEKNQNTAFTGTLSDSFTMTVDVYVRTTEDSSAGRKRGLLDSVGTSRGKGARGFWQKRSCSRKPAGNKDDSHQTSDRCNVYNHPANTVGPILLDVKAQQQQTVSWCVSNSAQPETDAIPARQIKRRRRASRDGQPEKIVTRMLAGYHVGG